MMVTFRVQKLSRFGFEHSLKDVNEMIQEKDLDQDGRINFDEFLKIITRDTSSLGLLLIVDCNI